MMMTTMVVVVVVVVVIRIICKPIESKMCVVQGSDQRSSLDTRWSITIEA